MTCLGPENAVDCDNPACRRGGCQGRMPKARRNAVYAGTSRAQMAALVADTPAPKPGDRARLYAKE
jgi:hypothetical protein